jgi:hypothetical protein
MRPTDYLGIGLVVGALIGWFLKTLEYHMAISKTE